MHITNHKTGYSLVEVLVSISVLLIATVGPLSIATQGIKSSQFALEQNTAYFLAQEGIEAMFAVRNYFALLDIDDGLGGSDPNSSWDWVINNDSNNSYEILNAGNTDPCRIGLYRLNNNGKSCNVGVSFDGGPYNGVSFINCNSQGPGADPDNCDILLDETNNRAVYNHTSGSATQYDRIITITRETDYSIKVESTVTWQSHVFSTPQSVSEVTYLFDSNFE